MEKHEIKVLLFDMGGVLCRLNDPLETFGLQQSLEEFMDQWLLSESVREFERGAIDTQAFARNIVREANLSYGAKEFLQRFDTWPEGLFPGAVELVQAIPDHFVRAILSNTNAVHWHRADIGGLLQQCFENIFLSFETGLLKPDAQVFEHVASTLGFAPEEILFFDDNPLNTNAAEKFGYRSTLIREFADLPAAFAKHGILSRS